MMIQRRFPGSRVTAWMLAIATLLWVHVVHAQALGAHAVATGERRVEANSSDPRGHSSLPAQGRSLWRSPDRPVLALGGSALVVSLFALSTGLRARDVQAVLDARCSADRVCSHDGFERDREHGQRLWNASRALSIGAALLTVGAVSWWTLGRREGPTTRLGLGVAAASLEARFERRF